MNLFLCHPFLNDLGSKSKVVDMPPPSPSNPVCRVVSAVRQKCGLVTSARHTGPLSPWWLMSETAAPSSSPGLRKGEAQSSSTYARRVQQVSPSTSAPGALSVLTDSFSLAGMLTGWRVEPEGREGEEKKDESRVARCCVIRAHKSASSPSETVVKHLTQYIITQSYFYQQSLLVGLLTGVSVSDI